jgi:hypothetical protein
MTMTINLVLVLGLGSVIEVQTLRYGSSISGTWLNGEEYEAWRNEGP